MSEQPKIGFIGVGMMGHGMASNLVAKGFPTTVLGHRNRKPVDDLVAKGATRGQEPGRRRRARPTSCFICVTGSPQVEEIVYGAERAPLGGARKGLIVVDCSTSEPDSTTKILPIFAAKGVPFVDAPLARTPKEAAEGRLNVMVGRGAGGLRRDRAGAAGLRREHLPRRRAGRRPQDQAHQQLLRHGPGGADRRGAGRGAEIRRRCRGAVQGRERGRRQLRHLPDDRALGARRHL